MNSNKPIAFLILLSILLLLVSCKESTTGIKFSHQNHLQRGLDCEFCHTQVMDEKRAGIPGMDICSNCHSIDTTKPSKDCLKCHTHPNMKVTRLIPEIYDRVNFSHQVHTKVHQLPCDQCHIGMKQSKSITGMKIPPMETCLACHRKEKEPTDCVKCHPGWDKDHPPKWHSGNWKRVHGERSTEKNGRCTVCHTNTACINCHKDQEPESHTQFWKRRGHGLQVGWGRQNCQVCHQTDFCVRCHSQTPPSSHVAGWEQLHCYRCHLPIKDNTGCNVCHKSVDHSRFATRIPPTLFGGIPMAQFHCTDCHYIPDTGAPTPKHPLQYPCTLCHFP